MTYRIIKRREYVGFLFYIDKQGRRGRWKTAAWNYHQKDGGRDPAGFSNVEGAEAWIKNQIEYQTAKDEVVKVIST